MHKRTLIIKFTLYSMLLPVMAACTQQPAQVELKGQNLYSRNSSSYASLSPSAGGANAISANTPHSYITANNAESVQPAASVAAIGVSDLTPPSAQKPLVAAKAAPEISPFHRAHPDTLKPAAGNDAINPWTHQPRGSEAVANMDQSFHLNPAAKSTASDKKAMASNVATSSESAISQLDSVISNDGSIKKADLAVTNTKAKSASANASDYMWPVSSKKIISEFGPKGKGKANDGINIASASGEPVWAAADGEVVYVGSELEGYGNMVLIKHNGDKATSYAHLSRATVEKYDHVKQGDIVGYVGNTGNVKEPQLHFAIRDGKTPVDPMKYFDPKMASLR